MHCFHLHLNPPLQLFDTVHIDSFLRSCYIIFTSIFHVRIGATVSLSPAFWYLTMLPHCNVHSTTPTATRTPCFSFSTVIPSLPYFKLLTWLHCHNPFCLCYRNASLALAFVLVRACTGHFCSRLHTNPLIGKNLFHTLHLSIPSHYHIAPVGPA